MRRLLVFCAVMVTVFTAFAAVRLSRVTSVSAAGQGSLVLFTADPNEQGCPIGAGFTFCNQVPGFPGPQSGFQIMATGAVSGLSASIAAIPGMPSSFAAGDFTITTNTCTGSLASGAQCIVYVKFSPTLAGLRTAALTVTDAAGDVLPINLSGTGSVLAMFPPPSPPACIQGNAYTYCNIPVGGTSTAETFTVFAGAALTGLNVSLQPTSGLSSQFAAGDFTIAATTCTGVLPPLGTCTVSVEFTPTTAGLRAATLTATDSTGDITTIYLAGQTTTGLAFPLPVPSSNTLSCARVNLLGFCNEPTAGTTASNSFTIVNNTGTQITGLVISPPLPNSTTPPPPPVNFTVTSTSCSSTLAAGANCTVNVAFTPLGPGLQQGAITVTDTQGDVAGFTLSGVGDDFNLAIVDGQSPEVTVSQGNTATFMAQLNADAVFGQNGEMVTMSCPRNLPAFTTCAYMPCPITPVIGGSVPFSILIATSTKFSVTPEVPNPCNNPNAASSVPGAREPNGILRFVTDTPVSASRFPALLAVFLTLALLLVALGLTTTNALPSLGTNARRALVAFGMIAFTGALLACGGSGNVNTTATPIGTTNMVVPAQAVDSNGNSINAGRGLQITLDVIKQVKVSPLH